MILLGGSIDVPLSVVDDEKLTTGREISAGSNDVFEQSQLESAPNPAIARVILAPGLFTMILLPALLQGTS